MSKKLSPSAQKRAERYALAKQAVAREDVARAASVVNNAGHLGRKKAPTEYQGIWQKSVEVTRVCADNPIRARGFDTPAHVAANAEARRVAIREQQAETRAIFGAPRKRTPDAPNFLGAQSAPAPANRAR